MWLAHKLFVSLTMEARDILSILFWFICVYYLEKEETKRKYHSLIEFYIEVITKLYRNKGKLLCKTYNLGANLVQIPIQCHKLMWFIYVSLIHEIEPNNVSFHYILNIFHCYSENVIPRNVCSLCVRFKIELNHKINESCQIV